VGVSPGATWSQIASADAAEVIIVSVTIAIAILCIFMFIGPFKVLLYVA
jgi:hypothetical protein